MVVTKVSIQRYLIKIYLLTNVEFQLETIVIFDTSASQNCIREVMFPTKYYNETSEGLKAANGDKLKNRYKIPNAEICNNGIKFKNLF